jgi:glucose dehydrogenase
LDQTPITSQLRLFLDRQFFVGAEVVIGISSNERSGKETFRGSVVRLDPNTGAIVWQKYLISDEEQGQGASGAGIWSTPTYDLETDLLYITTGNNYTEPATQTQRCVYRTDGHPLETSGDAG